MPSKPRQTKTEAGAGAAPRGRGRPPIPFEQLSEAGKAKRLQRMTASQPKAAPPRALKAVPPAPPPQPAPPPAAAPTPAVDPDNLPPFAIREEIDVAEFMRRAMLGLINPTARQMIAARALLALQAKDGDRGAGGAPAEPGKKEQQAGQAQTVASGSRFSPTPPPTRLRAA